MLGIQRCGADSKATYGWNVQIPDIVNMVLSEMCGELRKAGLESEPEIHYFPSAEETKSHLLEVNHRW